jgi:hypothetical protein
MYPQMSLLVFDEIALLQRRTLIRNLCDHLDSSRESPAFIFFALFGDPITDLPAMQIVKPVLHALLIPNSLSFLSVASNRRLKTPAFRLIGAFVLKVSNLETDTG